MAKTCGATRLDIYGDSNLMVQQSMYLCDAISDKLIAYRQMYQSMEAKFEGCELKHIGRASNEEADALANIAPHAPQFQMEFSMNKLISGLSKSSLRHP
jgi:ribonuclease HI